MAQLGPDGHPARGGFLPPIPFPRRMWAGERLEFHDRLLVGDAVTRRSLIRDVVQKEGRLGLLYFVTLDHEISTGRGHAITERQDIVYRGGEAIRAGEGAARSAPLRPVSQPRLVRRVRVDPVLLFRYSALTFNGHRIHYDRTYALEIEGYPGLVVHGPLQATLLLKMAASVEEKRTPSTFEFRSVKPLFDGSDFTVNAREDGADLVLWTADEAGQTAMEARVTW